MRRLLICALLAAAPAFAETPSLPNSTFLVEEAWRADSMVMQHAVAYGSDEWSYTWTHEWASAERPHRVAWSLPLTPGPVAGDLSLDYVYQIKGEENDWLAIAPRVSAMVPFSGSSPGLQLALPVTISHTARFATHWNIRSTWTRGARSSELAVATAAVAAIGADTVVVFESELLLSPREPRALTVSPGIRWNARLLGRPGVVPGLAFPVTFSEGASSAGVAFHVMFEHSLRAGRDGR
ncbi:MAG TPA: hypothetical protein VFT12_01475 [Thermoanaerobaculia bacterium]|nr:hypothetical protein [Thermoanaerobaculia bacterium]